MRIYSYSLLSLFAFVATPSAGAAEAPQGQKDINILNKEAADKGAFAFDYGVPSSPAIRLIDQNAEKVQTSTGLKPFILSLPKVLSGGEQGQAIALDVSPFWLAQDSRNRSYNNYLEGGDLYKVAMRTHFNMAIYEGVSDTEVAKRQRSRMAVGFSSSLLNSSDPLLAKTDSQNKESDWQACLNRNGKIIKERMLLILQSQQKLVANDLERRASIRRKYEELFNRSQENPSSMSSSDRKDLEDLADQIQAIEDSDEQAISSIEDAEINKLVTECTKAANKAARYGMSLEVGGGMVWHGNSGKLSGFEDSGSVLWASYRYPMGVLFGAPKDSLLQYWVIGASARVGFDEFVKTGNGTTPEVRADTWDAWGGLEHLSETNRLALQAGYQSRDADNVVPDFDRKRWRYQASFTQLVEKNSGIWLKLAYGYVDQKGDDDKSILISITFSPPDASNLFGLGK